ncbi:putative toxin-antitoxin system toxin component, PIN family [Chamaesiphon sp.]|uniref:PIN domain-containing protein n=1 Tax=Chamaesiphon sp. TaxID=2814140 RepID=UPI0035939978
MLRLCLDLNIWVAALLADRKGRTNTGSQYLVEIVRSGSSPVGVVNLIISLGMLDELKSVIVEYLGLSIETADAYVSAIEEYAKLGAQLTLGGTGVIGIRDTEDAHVLETAIAGRADFLVTANFKDFIVNRDTKIEIPDRHAIYYSSAHSLQIVHPYLMLEWIRGGDMPKISPQYPL